MRARIGAALAVLLSTVPSCTLEFPPELVPCSQLAGQTSDLPPDAPPLPALGQRFVDPTFRTCITRISDATLDATIPDEPREATLSLDVDGMLSPDGSRALYSTQGYRLYDYDVLTPGRGAPTRTFTGYAIGFEPPSGLALVTADAADRMFARYVVETRAFTPLSSFGPGLPYAPDGLRAADRSLSADGSRALLSIALDARHDVAVLEVATGALVGLHPDVSGASLLSPSGRWVVQTTDTAWHRYPSDFAGEGVEVLADRTLFDADTFVLEGGHDGLAIVDGTYLVVFDLDAAAPTEVARLPLVDSAFLGSIDFGAHLDGGAVDRPGWLVVTMSDCPSGSAMCTDPASWARPKIALVGIGAEVVVHDLAWHFGSDRPVRAIASRDLSRVVFSSDWGGGPSEAYAIEVPTALLRLR